MIEVLGFFGFFKVVYDLLMIFLTLAIIVGLGVILYELCMKNGLKGKALLSFIPIGNIYIMNELLGERVHVKVRKLLWIWYGIFYILALFIGKFSIVTLIIFSYYMYLMLKEFKGMDDKKSFWIHMILAVLTNGITFIYSIYKYRNNEIEVCESVRDKSNDESFKESILKIKSRATGYVSELIDESVKEDEESIVSEEPRVLKGDARTEDRNYNGNVFRTQENSVRRVEDYDEDYDEDFDLDDNYANEDVIGNKNYRKGINL